MNCLIGKIVNIETEGTLSIVQINVSETIFKSVIIETEETADYLKMDNTVKLLFKETEVIIGKELLKEKISLQNQFVCKMERIERGKLLSQIYLKNDALKLSSIITSNSVDRLGLKEGASAVAMIKTNEIMLAKC